MRLMDDPSTATQATHYHVLNLTPALLASQQDPSSLIKRAYHRALLQNHPDKSTSNIVPRSDSSHTYTIDRITEAFAVLSSPKDRSAYDTSLRLSRSESDPAASSKFQTGVENVDLDDLEFDEKTDCWTRACRCGNERSYRFNENDLTEAGEEGELMVACLDCSLWLRVHFALVDDGDDEVQNHTQV